MKKIIIKRVMVILAIGAILYTTLTLLQVRSEGRFNYHWNSLGWYDSVLVTDDEAGVILYAEKDTCTWVISNKFSIDTLKVAREVLKFKWAKIYQLKWGVK